MIPDYEKAKNQAAELLKKYGVEEPFVPVFDIVEKEGLRIETFKPTEELKNISGFLDPENKIIYLNDNDPINRKTFTVAHELAHFILGHDKKQTEVLLRYPDLQNKIKSPLEQEANCFAANLLVPAEMLLGFMNKYKLNREEEDIDILSKAFGVSREVIRNQLRRA
jgi:Zn-dependent peptidase ImmA (M78 family)